MEKKHLISITNKFSSDLYIHIEEAEDNLILMKNKDTNYHKEDNKETEKNFPENNISHYIISDSHKEVEVNKNISHKMLITLIEEKQSGPAYFISPGNIYTIGGDLSVKNKYGYLAPVSYELTANEKIYEIVESKLCCLDFREKLLRVTNKGSNRIFVRVNDSVCPESLYEIREGEFNDFVRDNGKQYLTEIIDVDNEINVRFYLSTMNSYSYFGNSNLFDDKINFLICQTQDRFDYLSLFDYQMCKDQPTPSNEKELPYFKDLPPKVTGKKFVDCYFPPDLRIINSFDHQNKRVNPNFQSNPKDKLIDIENIQFKSAFDIFGSRHYLFKDKIEPNDIEQKGGVGDCWLMSVLASLAVKSDLIKRVFKTINVNPYGYYELYFYENGQKKIMFLDDYFPIDDQNQFIFGRPHDQELWVILIEKAFAKYEGGFSNLHKGKIENALKFLTGAKTDKYSNLLDNWDLIYDEIRNGKVICAGSNYGSDTFISLEGIIQGHAYSLLDAKEYNKNDKIIKLIKLRNPWGKKQWKGRFCDDSEEWTDDLFNYFEAEVAFDENGTFFMEFSDFCKEFSQLIICHINH